MTSARWLFLAVVVLVVTSCAAGPNVVSHVDPVQVAGFWKGLWHGLIYPVTFFISLFTDNVNIYEVRNNGNWYDFGFVAGIGLLHTVTSAGGRSSKSRRKTSRLKETS
ncbi:hypothetical protein SK803_32280 [Lentzea sp. BCCO 10_0856]|uniref:Integral membrane protein n=1 Tax=Lentzea miocenica TaxID=3095431 RepID=A0ABU4T9T1_9PSEU|nr:hypothetical protein [Lentzea sp. BCCO 10_0856]MDX8034918.1 hypothetical protein [Lentzea sp. BCCO 10_0856]